MALFRPSTEPEEVSLRVHMLRMSLPQEVILWFRKDQLTPR